VATLADAWPAILITLRLAALVTAILIVVATPIAWWLARSRAPWKEAVAAVVALPLVLPPTVLGFYLLMALAGSWGGRTLAFSFAGLVIGSVLFSLPFVVQPLRNAFAAVGNDPVEAAETLGASRWQTFLRVELPLARPGYLAGGILGFAHTVGEFGVVLMIGGNIPGETKTLSIAIYDYVERLQWGEAHVLAGGMVAFAFVVVASTMLLDRRVGRDG
jgi:molybdate transport system permease protein